ncbi:hypothetical protein, partial [Endothiovibrio diazotrophicus]
MPPPEQETTTPVEARNDAERLPQFGIPGFERLPSERRELYLKIPASHLDAARPIIEREIAELNHAREGRASGQADRSQADVDEHTADHRESMADSAIATFQRAERGDPDARKELTDAKRELLGEEATDEEVLQTVLEDQSGNLFADDVVLEVMFSDEETEACQRVLDLFQEFYGERGSVDSVIQPKQQIDLFCALTKGVGSLTERMFFARKALTVLTDS